jgi:hypothetical protein
MRYVIIGLTYLVMANIFIALLSMVASVMYKKE